MRATTAAKLFAVLFFVLGAALGSLWLRREIRSTHRQLQDVQSGVHAPAPPAPSNVPAYHLTP